MDTLLKLFSEEALLAVHFRASPRGFITIFGVPLLKSLGEWPNIQMECLGVSKTTGTPTFLKVDVI